MTHKVIMPDLGQTVAEGRIVRWLRKPGDKVQKGEPLLEVETDKVTMDLAFDLQASTEMWSRP
jgi:pyruvate dehydrogenase E2 component (dihydrolipoamide acetyltransferase)